MCRRPVYTKHLEHNPIKSLLNATILKTSNPSKNKINVAKLACMPRAQIQQTLQRSINDDFSFSDGRQRQPT